MTRAVLALERVSFSYGPRRVLEDVTLRVAAGELVCVVGSNGAGKTTLLRVAAGFERGTGRVSVETFDPRRTPRRELARRLAYLPQEYSVVFPFTVADVVL